jgi:DNA-binding response OmpR family regulator
MVEDEPCIRLLCTEALSRFGYQVDAAEDGEAAWRALNAATYDLMVTDNNMPKLSGLELLEKLRGARMALPVILVSGAMPAEELSCHPWLQVAAMLMKPFSTANLVTTVNSVLLLEHVREQEAPFPDRRNQPSTAGLRLE